MPDWDENSAVSRTNLAIAAFDVRDSAMRRDLATTEAPRRWHRIIMQGLIVPHPDFVGRYRGETGMDEIRVWVGGVEGVRPSEVTRELTDFESRLQGATAALDALLPANNELDDDGLSAVVDLAAWTHSEWIRIHPFANGTGRSARLWANFIFMRYGVAPAVRLRPRPDSEYEMATASAMLRDWRPTAICFRKLLLNV